MKGGGTIVVFTLIYLNKPPSTKLSVCIANIFCALTEEILGFIFWQIFSNIFVNKVILGQFHVSVPFV